MNDFNYQENRLHCEDYPSTTWRAPLAPLFCLLSKRHDGRI